MRIKIRKRMKSKRKIKSRIECLRRFFASSS